MNMELNQTVECTFFASAFNVNDLQITTLDQYIDQIRSKKYASAITRLRAEYLAGHAEEGDKRKKKLPLLVAGGIMKGDENANTWYTTAIASLSISTACRLRQKIFSAGQRGCLMSKPGISVLRAKAINFSYW